MLRLVQLLFALLAAGFIVVVAVETLTHELQTSDVRRMARTIERNQIYRERLVNKGDNFDYSIWLDQSILSNVVKSQVTQAFTQGCVTDASRSVTSVEFGPVDQAFLSEANDQTLRILIAQAYRFVAQRLKCSPVDGNAWLLRARLAELQLKDFSPVAELLDLSYLYSPAEKWIIVPRLRFVGYMIETSEIAPPAEYGVDLDRFVRLSRPIEVAGLYADSGNIARGLMRSNIDRQRLDRRVQILRRIDALGVSYPVPDACRSAILNGPPGSELEMRRPADLIEACSK